ncbi:MAG TPA: LLM class flavin-dependent oxidoreductase [Acetobacteraceae bacterium]|jgi:5,10-methylenetetrahydromethanopterin reductase|nr:LLM class flavin-dependent oxidoreductase [Acetobacteraceae bacterium]
MSKLRVAIRIPVGRPLPELAAFAARCEAAGFDGVGIHDHPSSGRDAYLALALAAQATRRIRLFPATSSPLVRHPLVLASLAHSLDEIAPGRCCLTVGPGFISTRTMGKHRARVDQMRQAILDLRQLLTGDEVTFGPASTRLRNSSATPTPVYLLAAGPRMIELAGEVADGAFLMVGLHPGSVTTARQHLEAGAKRAGRSLANFPITFIVTLGLGADAEAGPRWMRSWFAPGRPFLAYPSVANMHWLRAGGGAIEDSHDPTALTEAHAHALADAFGLFGSPARCADRLLRAREEAGINDVFFFPAHDLAGGYQMPEAELLAFERIIRPRLDG